jgi:hypothetical protein
MESYQPDIYEDESSTVLHGMPEDNHIWSVVDASDRYQAGAHNITHGSISPTEPIHATQEWADSSIVEHHSKHPSQQKIHVVQIGAKKWIMDGHHRYLGNKLAGRSTPATIFHWRESE